MILDALLSLLPRDPSEPPPVRVRERWIAGGDRGARHLVELMAEEARASLRDPWILEEAADLLPHELPAPAAVASFRDWLTVSVVPTPDPEGTEVVRTPSYMLEDIQARGWTRGDCDDVATLAAAIGLAAGFPARFTLYAFGNSLPYSHVFCELYTMCAGWLELDVHRPAQTPPGADVQRVETHEV